MRNFGEIISRGNYIIQLPIWGSSIVYTTDWELPLLVIILKGSNIYFNKNTRYKYTDVTSQKDKYLMADKTL